MKEKMLNNFSLKILSIVGAIIMWIVIINVYDPSVKVTVSGVTVQLLNEEALSNMGYSYEIEDGSKISVYVSGPRSLVSNISASDILATVDLSTVNIYSDYVDIEVKLQKSGSGYASVQLAPKTTAVKINIENRSTKTFEIEASVVNSPANGYVIGDCQILPSTITITGAQSLIRNIAGVRAVVDVSNAVEDVAKTCKLEVYDGNGKIINQEKLDMSRREIEAKVAVFPVKEVALQLEKNGSYDGLYTGVPANGYVVTGISADKETVRIAGDKYLLDGIEQIELPKSAIDVSGISQSTTYDINLQEYMPEGVTLVDSSVIAVTVNVEAIVSVRLDVGAGDIAVSNLAEGLKAEITSSTFTAVVTGRGSAVGAVNLETVKPTVDLTGMEEGVHEVEVRFNIPGNCHLNESYKVTVHISSNEETTAPVN